MSVIWSILTGVSLLVLIVTGKEGVTGVLLSGSAQAVELTVNLVASYAFWSGFFEILQDLGVSGKLSSLLRHPIRFLFPSSSKEAKEQVCLNLSASFLGLGNAATPAGISAVEELEKGESGRENAALFFVLSCSGLQILPATLIGLRAAAGSARPAAVLLPCALASLCAAIVGVTLCKIVGKIGRKRQDKREKQTTCLRFGKRKSGAKTGEETR